MSSATNMTLNNSARLLTSSIVTSDSTRFTTAAHKLSTMWNRKNNRGPPPRRALTELGTSTARGQKRNLDYANELLTIDAESFRQKYNFDPIAFKPLKQNEHAKYGDYVMLHSDVAKAKEMKEQIADIFSLPPAKRVRTSLSLSCIAVPLATSEKKSVVSEDNTTENSSRLPSTTEEECIEDRLQPPTAGVQTATLTNSKKPRQTLITDFTQHRKRLFSTSKSTAVADEQQQPKKRKADVLSDAE